MTTGSFFGKMSDKQAELESLKSKNYFQHCLFNVNMGQNSSVKKVFKIKIYT